MLEKSKSMMWKIKCLTNMIKTIRYSLCLALHTKINSTWITNIRIKTVKLQQESIKICK